MNPLAKLLKGIDRISTYLGWAAAFLAVPQVAALIYEVFARYVFLRPTIWSYDVTYMLYGTHYLLGAAYTLHVKGHIRIDVIYGRLRPRRQALIDVIGYLVVFFPVLAALLKGGLNYAAYAFEIQEVSQFTPWQPLLWPFKSLIFVGFFLLALQSLAELIRNLYLLVKGEVL